MKVATKANKVTVSKAWNRGILSLTFTSTDGTDPETIVYGGKTSTIVKRLIDSKVITGTFILNQDGYVQSGKTAMHTAVFEFESEGEPTYQQKVKEACTYWNITHSKDLNVGHLDNNRRYFDLSNLRLIPSLLNHFMRPNHPRKNRTSYFSNVSLQDIALTTKSVKCRFLCLILIDCLKLRVAQEYWKKRGDTAMGDKWREFLFANTMRKNETTDKYKHHYDSIETLEALEQIHKVTVRRHKMKKIDLPIESFSTLEDARSRCSDLEDFSEIEKAIAKLPLQKDLDRIIFYEGKKKAKRIFIVDKSYMENHLVRFSSLNENDGYIGGKMQRINGSRLPDIKIHTDVVDQDLITRGESRDDYRDLQIDHINRVRIDDRLRNLQLVSQGQNARNRKDRVGYMQNGRWWRLPFKFVGDMRYISGFANECDVKIAAEQLTPEKLATMQDLAIAEQWDDAMIKKKLDEIKFFYADGSEIIRYEEKENVPFKSGLKRQIQQVEMSFTEKIEIQQHAKRVKHMFRTFGTFAAFPISETDPVHTKQTVIVIEKLQVHEVEMTMIEQNEIEEHSKRVKDMFRTFGTYGALPR